MTLRSFCVTDNFDEGIAAEKVIDEAMERFYRAHVDYHQILQTVEERQVFISANKLSCIKILSTELAATCKFRDKFLHQPHVVVSILRTRSVMLIQESVKSYK